MKFVTKGMELLAEYRICVHALISDGYAYNVTMIEKFDVRIWRESMWRQ
jgi:hypothetical protein